MKPITKQLTEEFRPRFNNDKLYNALHLKNPEDFLKQLKKVNDPHTLKLVKIYLETEQQLNKNHRETLREGQPFDWDKYKNLSFLQTIAKT